MNRLQELREEKGLNKQEMADELGLAYTTYIGYEKGDRDPKSEKWKEFARHFGVSVDYLIGISETKIPVTTKDDGQEEKYEEIKQIFDKLTDENVGSLRDYALYLLQRQKSQGDQ